MIKKQAMILWLFIVITGCDSSIKSDLSKVRTMPLIEAVIPTIKVIYPTAEPTATALPTPTTQPVCTSDVILPYELGTQWKRVGAIHGGNYRVPERAIDLSASDDPEWELPDSLINIRAPICGVVKHYIDYDENTVIEIHGVNIIVSIYHTCPLVTSGYVARGQLIAYECNIGYTWDANNNFCGADSQCGYHIHIFARDKNGVNLDPLSTFGVK